MQQVSTTACKLSVFRSETHYVQNVKTVKFKTEEAKYKVMKLGLRLKERKKTQPILYMRFHLMIYEVLW